MRKSSGVPVLAFLLVATLAFAADAQPPTSPRVVATYFHRTLRCQTCLQIEALARYDVTDVMADDVEAGRLAWRSLNFEEEPNAHCEEDYGLEGPSLVIALEQDGKVLKWVRLDRVWEIYEDVEALDRYLMGTVREYLAAAAAIAAGEAGAP